MGLARQEWVWMPHPGHFIGAWECRFRLNTYVGGYIVSTVGEYRTSYNGEQDTSIGRNRLYETMVFRAVAAPTGDDDACCPWRIVVSDEVDFEGYNDAVAAQRGHMALCEKWAALP